MVKKVKIKKSLFVFLVFLMGILVCTRIIHAQNWIGLPPNNILLPLWPPTLSPLLLSAGTPVLPLPITPAPTVLAPTAAISPLFTAEQAGYWTGTWYSLLKILAGTMTLDLVENPQTGLSGTAFLAGTKPIVYGPVDVAGPLPVGESFTLNGTYDFLSLSGTLVTFTLELNCTLVSDTNIIGTYYINKVGFTSADYGEFTLNLITPVITAPAPIAAPTPVVPTVAATVPVPTAPTPVTLPVPTVVAPALPTAAVSGLFWNYF